MLTAKLKLDTDELVGKLSDNILDAISDSEEIEGLTDKARGEMFKIIEHALICEIGKMSEFDMVSR